MINIQTEIHDKFSIEFKIGYINGDEIEVNEFSVNTWIFVPHSLDINPQSYSQSSFYRDLRTQIRLITPVFTLAEMAEEEDAPINHLNNSLKRLIENCEERQIQDFEYNVKMFAAIFKSALRNEVNIIISESDTDTKYHTKEFLKYLTTVLAQYRMLGEEIGSSPQKERFQNYFIFCDEFMSDLIYRQLFRVITFLRKRRREVFDEIGEEINAFIKAELLHRDLSGYSRIDRESRNENRDIVYRSGLLKKYIESELFLDTRKKKDALLVEQIYLSLAAGVSMVFATIISFSATRKFGNFTMPLFVALVVSYMLKDRIKDLMRYYFAHKLKHKYFDNKTGISIGKYNQIGVSKEGMDFIDEEKVPNEIIAMRGRSSLLEADNKVSNEKIILFRKYVKVNRQALENITSYHISGVNEILRLNLSTFLRKMDDPYTPLYVLKEDGEYELLQGSKVYYLNFIMQFIDSDNNSFFKHYRVILNREGITEILELS